MYRDLYHLLFNHSWITRMPIDLNLHLLFILLNNFILPIYRLPFNFNNIINNFIFIWVTYLTNKIINIKINFVIIFFNLYYSFFNLFRLIKVKINLFYILNKLLLKIIIFLLLIDNPETPPKWLQFKQSFQNNKIWQTKLDHVPFY